MKPTNEFTFVSRSDQLRNTPEWTWSPAVSRFWPDACGSFVRLCVNGYTHPPSPTPHTHTHTHTLAYLQTKNTQTYNFLLHASSAGVEQE